MTTTPAHGSARGLIERLRAVQVSTLCDADKIERAQRALLAAMARGEQLHGLTTVDEHVAALRRGPDPALGFRV